MSYRPKPRSQVHINPQGSKTDAYCLAKVALLESMTIDRQAILFIQYALATNQMDVQMIPLEDDSYLKDGRFPYDHNSTRKLKV